MEKQNTIQKDNETVLFFTTATERLSINHENQDADVRSEQELLS